MPGILLELSRLAEETGIEFESITPHESAADAGFQQVPIPLVFDGNFYELSDFLFRLGRSSACARGELHATGRLFSVESLAFAEAQRGFPELTATLTVNAYVFGTGVPAKPLPARPPRRRPRRRRPPMRRPSSGGEPLMAKRIDPLKAKQAKQKKIAIALGVSSRRRRRVPGAEDARRCSRARSRSPPPRDDADAGGSDTRDGDARPACAPAAPAAVRGVRRLATSRPASGEGQLQSFELFRSKDPFEQQAGATRRGPAPAPSAAQPTPVNLPTAANWWLRLGERRLGCAGAAPRGTGRPVASAVQPPRPRRPSLSTAR